ncbi:MAG: SUMF1/EgtB/PvdO family nonheme iron enzyme [Bacteroidota bacterium]
MPFLLGLYSFLLLLPTPNFLFANDLRLSHLSKISSTQLQVDVSWANSWRNGGGEEPEFHDAVWVFGKWRTNGGEWLPLPFVADPAAYPPHDSLEMIPALDEVGIMLRRAQDGMGQIQADGLELILAQALPPGPIEILLFGMEMVYVPEGPFFLGDESSFHHFRDSSNGSSFWVQDEAVILATDLSVGSEASLGGDIPASYPKGFGAFYLMKYELSQAQYRDFLNCLTFEQQQQRTVNSPKSVVGTAAMASSPAFSQRNGLVIAQSGQAPDLPAVYACEATIDGQFDQTDDGQNRAANFLNGSDLLAYLDWAGLRPMTELEFEKACRGPIAPLAGEFAWGTAQVIDANTLVDDGLETESVSEIATATAGLASHGYAGPQGALRVGFGGTPTSDRLQSGSSYYGARELSGNVWEICVGVDSLGLLFDGQHGDGQLNSQGEAEVPGWQTGAMRYRGGGFNSGIVAEFRDLAVSDRFYHDLIANLRRGTSGGRGARTMGN